MTPDQISKLLATEKRDKSDPRAKNWHYRRTPSTAMRDAIWEYANRRTDSEWEMIPTPSMKTLLRLRPMGRVKDKGLFWQGFHDPEEYEAGY